MYLNYSLFSELFCVNVRTISLGKAKTIISKSEDVV